MPPPSRTWPTETVSACVEALPFPDPRSARADGLLAQGGDLQAERLVSAYAQGIFPWYSEPPILWFSPDPRMVLTWDHLIVNRTLRKNLKRARYEVRFDSDFRGVIEACREAPRPEQGGTWITHDMVEAYCALHEIGIAHSVESYQGGELVGGLYGVSLGSAFFGESMFTRRSDAGKVAFVHLARRLQAWRCAFLDCQVHTEHTEKLGAQEWSRDRFLDALERAMRVPTRVGAWS